ncbi:MAG: HAD family hydrolase [Pseudomonadota bacterium]
MSKPKAIFFDLDETLVDNVIPVQKLFAEMYFQFSDRLGADRQDAFFAALRVNAANLWATMFETEVAPEQQFADCFATTIESTCELPNAEARELAAGMLEGFVALSANNVRLQDGASDTLQTLREQGYITGIITNGMERVQLGKVHQLGLQDQVDHVIVSAQARAHKPHAPVFEMALARAGVEAHQAWQIGDHATNDVAGAIRAGMGGVFYDPGRDRIHKAFAELEESPTYVANHLLEVVDLAASHGV